MGFGVISGFSLRDRIRSFGFALSGLGHVLRSQHNAWIHLVATIGVVALGAALEVSRYDWCWLIAAIAGVWCAEAFNTAIERLADSVTTDPNPLIGQAKDAAAGGVLVVAMGAAVIGLLILGPPLWSWLSGSP